MNKTKLFLASAVIALGVSLTGCGKTTETSSATTGIDTTAKASSSCGEIAYIRMDSLMSGFGMYIDLSTEFSQKQEKITAELSTKGRSLEREAMDYQDKAQKGLITRYQAATIEEGLAKKQQDIVAYRDRVMNDLAEEQTVMSNKISAAVMEYLKEYNATKKYGVIFQTNAGNPILIADPALDITQEVLAELNKRYLAGKTTATPGK